MSSKLRPVLAALSIVAVLAPAALACLWDSDTLQMERRRFPGVLELITGRFVRHSPAYYEWRIKDRTKKLEVKPGDPPLIDDLAVAYDKLGQQEKGIALLEETLKKHPDRYETLANLGTLLFHAGQIEESKAYIERAIEINPDAHFGRERYQLLLTDYLLQSEREASGVMCQDERDPRDEKAVGFARFVLVAKYGEMERVEYSMHGIDAEANQRREDLNNAAKGVLGMMHFANYQSPALLEALGDLLMTGAIRENGTELASRAYLRAAAGSNEEKTAEKYRVMAEQVLANHTQFLADDPAIADLPKLQRQLDQEIADAKDYVALIAANERKWIASGRDVDREFAAVYYDSLDATIAKAARTSWWERIFTIVTSCVFPLLVVTALITALVIWIRRRRRAPLVVPEPIPKAF